MYGLGLGLGKSFVYISVLHAYVNAGFKTFHD